MSKIINQLIAYSQRWPNFAEAFCVVILCALAVGWIFLTAHPYYFGDELFSFFGTNGEHAFLDSFGLALQYKPRFIFYALWAMISDLHVPRLCVAALVATLWITVILLSYRIARSCFDAPFPIALLIATIAAFTRFSATSRYDYLSATIDLGALIFFLISMRYVLQGFERGFRPRAIIVIVASAVSSVFVYEKYIAGTFALGVSLAVASLARRQDTSTLRLSLLVAALIAILPLGLFILATAWAGSLPITTGTAAQQVMVDGATIIRALQYVSNLLFGTNFGKMWVVGSSLKPLTTAIIVIVLLLLWARLAKDMTQHRTWNVRILFVLFPAGAMIAAAALPNISESRWIAPVAIFVGFFIQMAARTRWVAASLLTALILVDGIYLASGRMNGMGLITASIHSREIGKAAATIKAGAGKVIGVMEPEIGWVLRGTNFGSMWSLPPGRVYAEANGLSVRLEPKDVTTTSNLDFALVKQGSHFRVVTGDLFSMLIDPDSIPDSAGEFVGSGTNWNNWFWTATPDTSSEGLLLSSGFSGFLPLEAANLKGKLLLYRAKTLKGESASMRLQINWQNAKGKLIYPSIDVVEVRGEWRNYAMLLFPPEGARQGLVYATLHTRDDTPGAVLLGSVRLLGVP